MTDHMKCLAKLKPEPGIWMHEEALPEIGHNDLLIKIQQTAICGTDIHIYHWDKWSQHTIPIPMTIGHEYMGVIAGIGQEVSGFELGDRVSGEGHITCGHCRNCRAGRRHLCRNAVGVGVNRPGAFAEYLLLPAINAFKLPDDISDDIATIFDPLGNAVHTVLSHEVIGEDVLITGAGPIGAMAAAISQYAGAKHTVITDINPYRLALAQRLGATRSVNVNEEKLEDVMKELDMHEGFDVCLEMSGSETGLEQLLDTINHGGKIAMLGIPSSDINIDISQLIFKGLTLKGIYGREMFETWYKMASLVQAGLNVEAIITHRFNVDDYQDAFEIMASGQAGKVIMDWR